LEFLVSDIISVFNLVASGYDSPGLRFFPFAADQLVFKAKIRSEQRVLDVATGTGHVATAAAQAIKAAGGRLTAIDLSTNMLDKAEKNVQKMALGNVDFHEMDAQDLEFRGKYFDAVLCGFGLFFLPDILQGLKSWKRVLKPGGKLAMSTFSATSFEPLIGQFFTDLQAITGETPEVPAQHLSNIPACQTILQSAGFESIDAHQANLGFHLASAEVWWEIVWYSGLRMSLLPLSEAEIEKLKTAHLANIQKLATEEGIYLPVDVIFSLAKKPA
jgi:arsenite methyltransferase